MPVFGGLHGRGLLYRRLNGGVSVVIGGEDPLRFCLRYRRNGIQGILHLLRRQHFYARSAQTHLSENYIFGLIDRHFGTVKKTTVLQLQGILIIDGEIPGSCFTHLDMQILLSVQKVKRLIHDGRSNSQLGFALLHDFGIMSVDIRNQLRRGFIDGFKAFPKLLQFLSFGPVGNVAKAVFAGSNAIIGAYGIGNTFGLNLFSVTAFLYGFRVDFFIECLDGLVAAEVHEAVIKGGESVGQLNGRCCDDRSHEACFHRGTDCSGNAVITGSSQLITIQAIRDCTAVNSRIQEQRRLSEQFCFLKGIAGVQCLKGFGVV